MIKIIVMTFDRYLKFYNVRNVFFFQKHGSKSKTKFTPLSMKPGKVWLEPGTIFNIILRIKNYVRHLTLH